MKYMGSKRYMLKNGLGKLIRDNIKHCERFVDPFCGSGAVVFHVAEKFNKPILASDLQKYSTVLANAVIGKETILNSENLEKRWLDKAEEQIKKSSIYKEAKNKDAVELFKQSRKIGEKEKARKTKKLVIESRKLCEKPSRIGPIWNAYGGHYFSPLQALAIDYLIKNLPKREPDKSVCLASLIETASKCAAAPGHTAQPFQPKVKSAEFILQSWKRDIFEVCKNSLKFFSELHAKGKGRTVVANAQNIKYQKGDLVIVDPPYSGVQYSRFYHVLETIARGKCGAVSGIGRYPELAERPQSKYSNAGQSKDALDKLLKKLSKSGAMVILTFPEGNCSNGLSGKIVKELANKWFDIKDQVVHGHFSTLGGNNNIRKYKIKSKELLLLLKPKSSLSWDISTSISAVYPIEKRPIQILQSSNVQSNLSQS